MLDIDSMEIEELERWITRIQTSVQDAAKLFFPDKNPGFVKNTLLLSKYIANRIEILDPKNEKREQKLTKLKEQNNNLYSQLAEYAQWL